MTSSKIPQIRKLFEKFYHTPYPKWISFMELNSICFRYGGRIHDLLQRGFKIERRRDRQLEWYRLATPRESIDYENMVVLPVEQQELVL
jgi:hypothetical protein